MPFFYQKLKFCIENPEIVSYGSCAGKQQLPLFLVTVMYSILPSSATRSVQGGLGHVFLFVPMEASGYIYKILWWGNLCSNRKLKSTQEINNLISYNCVQNTCHKRTMFSSCCDFCACSLSRFFL